MKTKKCSYCSRSRKIEFFGIKNKKTGLRQSICKDCQRVVSAEHYRKNRKDQQTKEKQRREKRASKNSQKIYEFLKENPCIDCGEINPVKLQFDHQRDKVMDVSAMVSSYNWHHLEEEIVKCVVRCANCHLLKTAKDQNWRVYKLWLSDTSG